MSNLTTIEIIALNLYSALIDEPTNLHNDAIENFKKQIAELK